MTMGIMKHDLLWETLRMPLQYRAMRPAKLKMLKINVQTHLRNLQLHLGLSRSIQALVMSCRLERELLWYCPHCTMLLD